MVFLAWANSARADHPHSKVIDTFHRSLKDYHLSFFRGKYSRFLRPFFAQNSSDIIGRVVWLNTADTIL